VSYVVSIVRDRPIEQGEVRALASDALTLEADEADDFYVLHWTNPAADRRETFVLVDGSLDITSPSDAALAVAQELAAKLDARVVGEEGEDLSDADVAGGTVTVTGCGPLAASIAIIAALLLIYWLLE
jgi:hypothetical protein